MDENYNAIACIIPAAAVWDAYNYVVPNGISLQIGDVVRVPFGKKDRWGVVWEILDARSVGAEKSSPRSNAARAGIASATDPQRANLGKNASVKTYKLKEIIAKADCPPIKAEMRQFIDWMAAYTMQPRGAIVKMLLSQPEALEPTKPTPHYLWQDQDIRMTPDREQVKSLFSDHQPRTRPAIAEQASVSPAVVTGLVKAGALKDAAPPASRTAPWPDASQFPLAELSPAQQEAADTLRTQVREGAFHVSLLDGVTGSGKTEVYFAAIAEAMSQGKQTLVLLPEISLSVQWLARFEQRFGLTPTLWHSDVTKAQKRDAWRAVARGEAPLVVGARSALFLPFDNLGLIIIDEEHDTSYKQEEGVLYHARDMAIARAKHASVPTLLVSATPSLETMVNVKEGRYGCMHLPERHAGAQFPKVQLTDMRPVKLKADQWLSPALVEAMHRRLQAGEQSLLFLNRRGYAPLTLCRTCGHRFACPSCTSWLVTHGHPTSGRASLQCHHCGYRTRLPNQCPECEHEESFAACGPGIERVEEEVRAKLPHVRVAAMTSDSIRHPKEAHALLDAMEKGEIDILLGTQMIAKGHHFPNLTLVGILDADIGLTGGDMRAAEHSYQLLHQVAGRAGRAERPGEVMIQTYHPDHPVLKALQQEERQAFYQMEEEARERVHLPPFGRQAALILSGRDDAKTLRAAQDLAASFPQPRGYRLLGPAPAPLHRLRGQFRYRLLLQCERQLRLQPALRDWLATSPKLAATQLRIDIDPVSFM